MTEPHGVHWRQFGKGPEKALAIHCTLAHGGAWRGVGEELTDILSLHAYDLPSHGKSAEWDRTGDLHEACTTPGRAALTAPAHLIGHSFGATVALRLAVERPEAVRSLTLIEPVFFAAARAFDPGALSQYLRNAAYNEAIREADWPKAARLFNRTWGTGEPWDTLPQKARQYMTDRVWFVAHQSPMIFDDNADLMGPGRLERAEMPVLLLKGANSPSIIGTVHAGLAARLPNARQVTLKGVGHMGPITHPGNVAAAIREHLKMI